MASSTYRSALSSYRPAYTIFAMNGGEVSPRFEARQDQNKYLASLQTCVNFMPMIVGGIRRREGTIFVARTKFSGAENNKVRLIKFLVSSTQAYVCEFGDFYVRFFREGTDGNGMQIMNGPVPLELVTPWGEDMLWELFDFQSADVKDICSDGTINVYRLQRTDIDEFTLTQDTPVVPGVVEDEPTGTELGPATITLSATTGDSVIVTASSGIWLAGDVDRSIISGAGILVITSVDSASQVTGDIVSGFATVGPIPADEWHLSGTPGSEIDPSKTRKGLNIVLTFNIPTMRPEDVGKFIAVYGGFIKITRFVSSTKVFGHVYTTLLDSPSPGPPATLEWVMYRSAWDVEQGFPTSGCYFENRRYLCRDQTIWGTVGGDFINFALGSGDGDGINSTISDNEINPIRAIIALDKLYPMTASQVFQVSATGESAPLTPNDNGFSVRTTGSPGVKRHIPIRALNKILYIQDGGRNIRELVFNLVDNEYKSPDMFLMADHIVEFNAIKQIDYQGRPGSVLWAVREDGKVFPFTYERNENVVGWARFETGRNTETDGFVQSLCVIPRTTTGHDWVWLAVNRTINGVMETYIEYLDPQVEQCREWREAMTDSAAFRVPDENDVIHDLEHLEGETVWVIIDGMLANATQDMHGNVTSNAVVTGGQVTIDRTNFGPDMVFQLAEVGLNYNSVALTLEPVIPNEMGGPLMARGWEVAAARFRRTAALKINQEKIPLRLPSE
jgi:hypothetical protein